MALEAQVDNSPYISKDQLYQGDMVVTPSYMTGTVKGMSGDRVEVELGKGVIQEYDWKDLRPWVPQPIQQEETNKAKVLHSPAYLKETAEIKERAKTTEAHNPHDFQQAKWTHPNGHPRCKLCGDEEPVGGKCNMPMAWYLKNIEKAYGTLYSEPAMDEIQKAEDKRSSILMLMLPDDIAAVVKAFAAQIPEEDLAEHGREDEPHITIYYGVQSENPDEVRKALPGLNKFEVAFGKVGMFPAGEDGAAVLKVGVFSPGVMQLHSQVERALPVLESKWDKYVPHVTIAYLKPNAINKYLGNTSFEPLTFVANSMCFSHGIGACKEDIPFDRTEPALINKALHSSRPW